MIHRQRFFAPPGYMAQIYGYGRVSHKNQFEKGNSIPDQEARIQAYVQMRLLDPESPISACQWAKMYAEPNAQSAFSKPLKRRPAGEELLEVLRPGDHLIIDKLDRMARNVEDTLSLNRYFAEHGIRLHIVNMGGLSIDSGTVGGWIVLAQMAFHAEFESMLKGERVRDARTRMRVRGTDAGVGVPTFIRLEGLPPGKTRGSGAKRVFRDWAIPVFQEIEFLADSEHMNFCQIHKLITQNRKYSDIRQVSDQQVEYYYWFWKAWNDAGRPDLNELKFQEFTKQYKQRIKAGL